MAVSINLVIRNSVIKKFIVGIDEAGRGPLAGPMAIGIVVLRKNHKLSLSGIRDSKKLSPKGREEWFKKISLWRKEGKISFCVMFVSPKDIDTKGLSWGLRSLIEKGLKKISANPLNSMIFLDGGLKAPKNFKFQKTIIKGDEKIPVISLASIAAKVFRDRKMIALAKKYPKYGFEIHKGYGTLAHRKVIKKFGESPVHRKSFLTRIA